MRLNALILLLPSILVKIYNYKETKMSTPNWVTKRAVMSTLIAAPLLLASAFVSADEMAAAAPAAPAPDYTLTYNLGLYSNYMFRGTALSDGPAVQGGIDFAHSSGFYLGTRLSNIDRDFTGNGDGFSSGNRIEWDIYGGYAHTFDNGIGINFLANYYFYPHRENSFSLADKGNKQDTLETSVALSYKWFTYTFFYIPTNYYGAASDGTVDGTSDTKGATYNELKFNYKLPVGDLNFNAKVGYQHTPNLTGDEGDWAIGLNRDFSLPGAGKPIEGFNAGATVTDTFAVENQAYYKTSSNRDINNTMITFFVKRTW